MSPTAFKIAASAIALGTMTIGLAPFDIGTDAVGATTDTGTAQAARAAARAEQALARKQGTRAVQAAESAVAFAPQAAAYRGLLARSYLTAGRFASAEAAFRDTLTLDPTHPGAALSLALAQIAQGNWAVARATLEGHRNDIADADRGLALALAGDPVGAIELLVTAARAPEADAKTRQNLALSFALAGRWQEARVVASQDVSPADIDRRITQWAAFTQPTDAADQVASLLGVTPAQDPGQPARLALVQPPAQTALAVVSAPPVEPVAEVAATEPVAIAEADTTPVVAATTAGIVFRPRAEIVQAIPAPLILAPRVPTRTAAAPTSRGPQQNGGRYVVQIGAYDSAGVAEDGWNRLVRRHSALREYTPSSMRITEGHGAGLTRVSVAGFATESDARRLCGSLKASGGACFVRMAVTDAPVRWASLSRRYASR